MKTFVLFLALLLPVFLPAQMTARAGGAKKTVSEQKPEAEATVPGVTIPRAKGGYLGLALEGGGFKLSFYDAQKKPLAADVPRATARWKVLYQKTPERVILQPTADGLALSNPKNVRPPHNFTVFLVLLDGPGEDAQTVESYQVEFTAP